MFERRVTNLLPTAVLAVICASLALAWVALPAIAPPGWPGRLTVVLAAVAMTVLVLRPALINSLKAAEATRRYIDSLCELEPSQLEEEAALDAIPLRAGDHAWRELCHRVRERIAVFARRADELEMQRAGADVRARRLLAERDRLHEILHGLNDPVLAVDQFGELMLANPSAERFLALSAQNGHNGQHLRSGQSSHASPAAGNGQHPILAQLDRCEQLVAMLTETRRRRTPTQRSGELSLPGPEGKAHWFRISCRSLTQQDQDTGAAAERATSHGAVAVLTDISGQKAIQKRNAEFVSSVSHEMKAPLSSIRAYVELLADGEAEDEATREEFLGVIHSQADRLQRLVENLLNLARIEAGVVQVNKNPLSINELLQEAVGVMQPQAEKKQISLEGDFSPLYLGVLADRDMLLQAAINLVSNAIKYTPDGGRVTVRSRLHDQEVIFEVLDTGVGLSPEDCEKVFEKFYRVKKNNDMAPGTGLGLALVKHIAEDVHGGRIEVESKLGEGSTFRVILPGLAQLNA